MKRQKNKVDENKFSKIIKWFLLAASIVVIVYFVIYIVISLDSVKDIQTMNVKLRIGDYVGFNLDPESLNFGTVLPGSGSTRTVTLRSENPLKVHISFEGDTAKWMNVSKNNFILNGTETVGFSITAPNDSNLGNYNGKVIILFTKP
jgi:hypothetical protein